PIAVCMNVPSEGTSPQSSFEWEMQLRARRQPGQQATHLSRSSEMAKLSPNLSTFFTLVLSSWFFRSSAGFHCMVLRNTTRLRDASRLRFVFGTTSGGYLFMVHYSPLW